MKHLWYCQHDTGDPRCSQLLHLSPNNVFVLGGGGGGGGCFFGGGGGGGPPGGGKGGVGGEGVDLGGRRPGGARWPPPPFLFGGFWGGGGGGGGGWELLFAGRLRSRLHRCCKEGSVPRHCSCRTLCPCSEHSEMYSPWINLADRRAAAAAAISRVISLQSYSAGCVQWKLFACSYGRPVYKSIQTYKTASTRIQV